MRIYRTILAWRFKFELELALGRRRDSAHFAQRSTTPGAWLPGRSDAGYVLRERGKVRGCSVRTRQYFAMTLACARDTRIPIAFEGSSDRETDRSVLYVLYTRGVTLPTPKKAVLCLEVYRYVPGWVVM